MVDSPFRLLHSSVQSFLLLWRRIMQSWLFRTSEVEVNLAENGTRLEGEKPRFVSIFFALYSRWKLDLSFFNREILLMISLLLRMSTTILLPQSHRVFTRLVNFSSRTSTLVQARWPSLVHPMAVNWTRFLFSLRLLTSRRWNVGFLVCGSVVRAPEGTFGAAIAEGGVADLLKVIGLPQHFYSF